ncbi:MAG: protein-disulfide reductase DsbD family protein, partial [Bacteroidota bacterium]
NAQDTDSIQWKVSVEKQSDRYFLFTFSCIIPDHLFLYVDSAYKEESLFPGLKFFDDQISVVSSQVISPLEPYPDPLFDGRIHSIARDSMIISQLIKIPGEVPSSLRLTLQYTRGGVDEFNPGIEKDFEVALEGGVDQKFDILKEKIDIDHAVSACGDEHTAQQSFFSIFLLGLLGGFIALLTPCVFPLIPLTVSFFTKKSESRNKAIAGAAMYGFFILLIYILLSIPFHVLDSVNPEVLNNISTNVWLNLLFFFIFIFFAISFFGYFEITLPSGFVSRADAKSGIRSAGGIFFMALTLAIVSFSCTGPILGSLLAGALTNEGGAWQLTAGMGGFGLGLALPFALFAMFPNWLQSLPKSGGWLNTVKVVLGFLELAMAIKFLSNADLVKQWGLLKREVFIGLWVFIGILIVLYLSGLIRFPHDSTGSKISTTRKWFLCVFLILTIYISPGVTNTNYARLSLISGFPPPLCYSIYKEPVNCKHDVEPLRDYDQALALARKEKKPLLIDFTGWACVNCRRMEEQVWTNTEVRRLMSDEFVVVSLYVDDRQTLPAASQQTYLTRNGIDKDIVTIGDQWATFQSENFRAVAQPQYAILNNDEKLMTQTKAYTPNPVEFKNWLNCGLQAFHK